MAHSSYFGLVAVPRVSHYICTIVLPPTICYLTAAAASNLLHHQPHSILLHTHPSPFFQLKQRGPRVVSGCAARALMHFHLLLSSLFHSPLSCHQTLSLATTPVPHASAQVCLGIATNPLMDSSLLPVINNVRGTMLLYSARPIPWRLPG
ncbi:hypothetical protein BGY98DRAFT_256785 [Russula aff. rugulosa BPL654]|nr:hypothetical protein BGY98DRAFT_256785 [Russula aff. rugulosa BPL654]